MFRYSQLNRLIEHKGKVVSLGFGSEAFSLFSTPTIPLSFSEKVVPAGYSNRPDLIANVFFNDSNKWVAVMSLNGLFDPFESLNEHDRLILPD